MGAFGGEATSSYMKIYETCLAGKAEECKKNRLTESGRFTGTLGGGALEPGADKWKISTFVFRPIGENGLRYGDGWYRVIWWGCDFE